MFSIPMEPDAWEPIADFLFEEDEMAHLQWDSDENYRNFINHLAQLLWNTTWFDNYTYRFTTHIDYAIELRIGGRDNGLLGALRLRFRFVKLNKSKIKKK